MLSVFDQVYHFARDNDDELKELPSYVSRELRWAWALLPALWADLRSEWDPVVTATDASEWGHGCMRRVAPMDLITSVGRIRERWRFGRESMHASRALGAAQGWRLQSPAARAGRSLGSRQGQRRSWRQAGRPASQRCLTAWLMGPGTCRPAAGGRGPNTSSCLRGGVLSTGCGPASATRPRSGTACSVSATASSPSCLSARAVRVRRGSFAWPVSGPRSPLRGARMSGCARCRRK